MVVHDEDTMLYRISLSCLVHLLLHGISGDTRRELCGLSPRNVA